MTHLAPSPTGGARRRITYLAAALLVVGSAAPGRAQGCGGPCQRCVEQLRIPRDASGRPDFKAAGFDRQEFRFCLARERGGNGRSKSAR
ncbi:MULTISPECIES: hypothetical protein [Methylobacterium]|uniref:hypothetical protein n=1 Tax=Methylobacterium TaxID=407 RepID=UPI0013EB6CD0|nr:hypothetical protein [Methylobacterium sp. DB0501]NGM37001.1 hypothetical protein [Methylobacterium sp. DB0501]